MGREHFFFPLPSTLVLNLAPFWHNSSCWKLRETSWWGEKGMEERDNRREIMWEMRREKSKEGMWWRKGGGGAQKTPDSRCGKSKGRADHEGNKIMRRKATLEAVAWLLQALPSSVGRVGEWDVEEGEWWKGKWGRTTSVCLNSQWCAGLSASSSLPITSIPDTSMSGREETDAGALTAGRKILEGGLEFWITSRATDEEASRNRVGNSCVSL